MNVFSAQSPSEEDEDFEFEDAVDEFSEEIFLPVSAVQLGKVSKFSLFVTV